MIEAVTRCIPFIQHNDLARISMAHGQQKQAIPLIKGEVPFIRSGLEEQYLDYTSYLYKAKDSGVITYKDDDLLIAKYDNFHNGEIIKIDSLHGNREGFDKMLHTKFNLNDRFNKGDILAHHTSINDDGFLTLGCNLKTTYISHPDNFKDAMFISESCAKKMSTRVVYEETIDCNDTIPLLWNHNQISYPQGTFVSKAQPIFVIKERVPSNPVQIISDGQEILSPVSGRLYYNIKIDEIVKDEDEKNYYNMIYKKEIDKEEIIAQKISELFNEQNEYDSLIRDAFINYHCPQLNKKRSGKSIILTYYIVQEIPIMKACKLSNRAGNKGVISKIYPDEKMPRDQYGEYADIVVSAMCVNSRMNSGQLFELHMNRANHLYTVKIMNDNSLDRDQRIEKLSEMIYDAQPEYVNKEFREYMSNATNDQKDQFLELVKEHNIVQILNPPFTKFNYNDCLKFCKKYGNMNDSLKEPLYFENEYIDASFGHIFWMRLEHEPYKKYFSRSIGNYGRIGQPTRNNGDGKGGHRIGELETWSLLSHQAYENLLEFFISKSDSISEAARMLKYLHDDCPDKYTPFNQVPGILKVFKTFVEAAGYEMVEVDEDNNEIIHEDEIKKSPYNNKIETFDIDITEELNQLEKYN